MTVVAFAGVKHSPGVTTLAVAVASSQAGSALVVEADPAGGDIAARSGLALDPGLASLAAAARNEMTADLLSQHVQRLSSGVDLLAGPVSPRQSATALRAVAEPLVELFARLDHDLIVIDLGRIDDPTLVVPLLGAADRVVLSLRGTAEDVVAARSRLDDLRRHASSVSIAVTGSGPFHTGEVAAALGADAAVTLPWDPRAARALAAGLAPDRWLRRSALMRAARELTTELTESVVVVP
jgi:MinD-like ATPase involved in chromosome partitioning or flagellar assembly